MGNTRCAESLLKCACPAIDAEIVFLYALKKGMVETNLVAHPYTKTEEEPPWMDFFLDFFFFAPVRPMQSLLRHCSISQKMGLPQYLIQMSARRLEIVK